MAGLSTEQIGRLFVAVMETVEKGEVIEVGNDIKYAYSEHYRRVIDSKKAYEEKCKKNALNGSKGGKAKVAKRETGNKNEAGFKGLSKTQFRDMAKYICHEYNTAYVQYEIDNLFERLSKNEWKYRGQLILSKHQCEAVVYAETGDNVDLQRITPAILREMPDITHDYMECIDRDTDNGCLRVDDDQIYPIRTDDEIEKAVHAYAHQYDDE